MPIVKLFPGSVITQSGLYAISQSTGHRPDIETALYQGLRLPHCPEPGCEVSYSLVRATTATTENTDAKPEQQHRPSAA
jgi:hypothetical protein